MVFRFIYQNGVSKPERFSKDGKARILNIAILLFNTGQYIFTETMTLTGKIRRDFISCKLEGCINASICFRNNIAIHFFLDVHIRFITYTRNVVMINNKMAKNR